MCCCPNLACSIDSQSTCQVGGRPWTPLYTYGKPVLHGFLNFIGMIFETGLYCGYVKPHYPAPICSSSAPIHSEQQEISKVICRETKSLFFLHYIELRIAPLPLLSPLPSNSPPLPSSPPPHVWAQCACVIRKRVRLAHKAV